MVRDAKKDFNRGNTAFKLCSAQSIHRFSPNSPKTPISDDIDGISKHRLSPITPTLKHDNTQRFLVQVLLICDFKKYLPLYS